MIGDLVEDPRPETPPEDEQETPPVEHLIKLTRISAEVDFSGSSYADVGSATLKLRAPAPQDGRLVGVVPIPIGFGGIVDTLWLVPEEATSDEEPEQD